MTIPSNKEQDTGQNKDLIPVSEICNTSGKAQLWRSAWPPNDGELKAAVELEGQLLLLDGTGGSGTVAVPNAVYLPPKDKE